MFFAKELPGFGFIITILIFGSTGFYSLRLFLWNVFGKEVYEVNAYGRLRHYYHYKLFKDNIKRKNIRSIDFGYSVVSSEGNFLRFQENIDQSLIYYPSFRMKRTIIVSDIFVSAETLGEYEKFGVEFNENLKKK